MTVELHVSVYSPNEQKNENVAMPILYQKINLYIYIYSNVGIIIM